MRLCPHCFLVFTPLVCSTMSRWQELIKNTPVTTLFIIFLCSVLHLLQVTVGPPLSAVSLSPRLVLGTGDLYRVVSSAFYHANVMHIGMNMLSMAAVGTLVEKRVGSLSLAVTILASLLLTSLLYLTVAYLAYSWCDYTPWMYQHCVGFSGILFHLSVLECAMGLQPRSVFGVVHVPPALYPWVLLVVLQFFLPNLSFLGHLSGILVGTLQVHGFLDGLLPVEETLCDLDALVTSWSTHIPTQTNNLLHFVPTQRPGERPNGGIKQACRTVATVFYQLWEALYVILFGRGQRLNANATLWSESRPDSPSRVERSRLVRESEMV